MIDLPDRPIGRSPSARAAWARLRAVRMAAGPLLLLVACADAGNPFPPAESVDAVVVAPEQRTLAAGDTLTLAATLRSATGLPLGGRTVTWSSSDEAVVSVTPTGRVAAGRAGSAIVSASSEGRTGRAMVSVNPGPLARLVLDPAAATLAQGDRQRVTALGSDAAGNVLRLDAVVWTTDNPAVATVATVGAVGIVTAGVPGTAVVTGTTAGRSARATITVTPPARVPVDRIEVTPAPVVLEVGRTRQLSATVRDAGGAVLTGRSVAWTTDNPMAATVSAIGLVTAVTPGYATITATSEGKTFGVAITIPTPQGLEYRLVLVNGTPVPRTLYTTVETGADGVARTVRWDAYDGYFRLANGRYEQLVDYWMMREGSPVAQGASVTRGSYRYDLFVGGLVFQPDDGSPSFRGAEVEGSLVVARQLVPGTPELTFLHRLP